MFFTHLFDLIGAGEVITVDVKRLHELAHPRITYLIGSSTSEEIADVVRGRAAACSGPVMVIACSGPVMVIFDSDHSRDHVRRELDIYAPLVTPGSYCLVQDGVIDVVSFFRDGRPGPLPAIEDFLRSTDRFELDADRCDRFLVTHNPQGWLRRKA